jgi:hypothetical protein
MILSEKSATFRDHASLKGCARARAALPLFAAPMDDPSLAGEPDVIPKGQNFH